MTDNDKKPKEEDYIVLMLEAVKANVDGKTIVALALVAIAGELRELKELASSIKKDYL